MTGAESGSDRLYLDATVLAHLAVADVVAYLVGSTFLFGAAAEQVEVLGDPLVDPEGATDADADHRPGVATIPAITAAISG